SYMYNQLVVRPTSKLSPTQTLWVTFASTNDILKASVKTDSLLLAQRLSTAKNSTCEVADGNSVTVEQDNTETYEYYIAIPQAVLANAGAWYFSLEIREVPDTSNPTVYDAIATSGVYEFTVNNSLAGAGGSTPTDLDIVSLYLTSTNATEEAKDAAAAASKNSYPPYIGENGNWYEWDKESAQYVDSGVQAQGPQGPAPDTSKFVTTDTEQEIAATKVYSAEQMYNGGVRVEGTNGILFTNGAIATQSGVRLTVAAAEYDEELEVKFPAATGTVALISDVNAAIATAITTTLNTPV
ncbi:MAG: hypothetical protein NC350_04730, partial [Corallococcus sp.]|nr:hypothetical protein [Corallococcus sp.]